jgi:hypothetical protein
MTTTKIKGGSAAKHKGNMLEGLVNKSPKASDASMVPPRGSVNDDAVRSGVAATPRTLGPRDA